MRFFARHRLVVILPMLAIGLDCSCSNDASLQQVAAHASEHTASASFADEANDGTPDFLRLDTEQDRAAFRRWFTFLAEVQYFNPAADRPAEIVDCSALVRYCYREALRTHDGSWAAESHLPLLPPFASVQKYSYGRTPLGTALFRTRGGPFLPADLHSGVFKQFANAETLERFNTFRVSRDIHRAQAGDLLFFSRTIGEGHRSFHSMIFLGHSYIQPSSSAAYVVYDTGPDGADSGEIRRLTIAELLQFPNPVWRPYPENPQFLGVFRWNILRASS